MKFAVDLDACQNHGQCTYSARSLFSLDEQGQLAFRRTARDSIYESPVVDPGAEEDLEEAADMCPVQAIKLQH